jgi:long-chain acyl-CoA synthetase
VFLPNIPHYPEIFFGILRAGAVCVTCNPLYTEREVHYLLKDSGSRAVFTMDHPVFYPTAVRAAVDTAVETVAICNIKSYLPGAMAFIGGLLGKIPKAANHAKEHFFYDDIIKNNLPKAPAVTLDPSNDLALMIYTSGTTGSPKGACLTHSNLVFNTLATQEWCRIPHEEGGPPEQIRSGGFHSFLGVLPWYHIFGMSAVLLWACHTGSRMVCIPDPRAGNPPFTGVLQAVQKYRCTLFAAVPTIYMAFINHPLLKKFDLSSIMACISGGAPCPVEVINQFEEKTGAIIFEAYGLSETSPLATANPSSVSLRRIGSVGFPPMNTDIKIMDAETSEKELPRGEDGEIAIHGPQVMKGYWNNPEATDAVFREFEGRRYFLSGDIGHIDDEGYLLITDRKKDMILVGGFNVYPREVEEVLFTHPKVAMAAVVGLPDGHSGEKVKAFIQLKPGEAATEDEMAVFCKENLAGYKRPKAFEFRDTLPVSPVGKVLRRVLRDEEMGKTA